MASKESTTFLRPTFFERILNRAFGALASAGLGMAHNYLLQVKGRKTGRLYSTPVNLLAQGDKLYVVCPRGRAQWVRNVEASGQVVLKKRGSRTYLVHPVADEQKSALLKNYLDRYALTVQRY